MIKSCVNRSLVSKPNSQLKFFILKRWYCDNEDPKTKALGEQQRKTHQKSEKSNEVLNKLNTLLRDMSQPSKSESSLNLAKPALKRERKESNHRKTNEQQTKDSVLNMVKNVAESLNGNAKQTETELLKKFLSDENRSEIDSITSLSDIFKGMKIDRGQPQVEEQSRSQQVKEILNRHQKQSNKRDFQRSKLKTQSFRKLQIQQLDNINLFGSEPFGIFSTDPHAYTNEVVNDTWKTLEEREIRLAVTHPPSNYFQEMILWTEQGKLWKFPIDNEQGLEKEQNVDFTEHIFLEKHLDSWCPPKGPIRHFMELVCVGLSKNPYLTVEVKKEHIEWYRNYFEGKKQLLEEVGSSLNVDTKQIEKSL